MRHCKRISYLMFIILFLKNEPTTLSGGLDLFSFWGFLGGGQVEFFPSSWDLFPLCFHHVPKGALSRFIKCSLRHTQFFPTLFGPSSTSMDVKCKGDFKWEIYRCFYVEDAPWTRKSVEGPINVAPYYFDFFWGAPLFLRWIPPIHQKSLLNTRLRLPSILSLYFVVKFHKVFHHFATNK